MGRGRGAPGAGRGEQPEERPGEGRAVRRSRPRQGRHASDSPRGSARRARSGGEGSGSEDGSSAAAATAAAARPCDTRPSPRSSTPPEPRSRRGVQRGLGGRVGSVGTPGEHATSAAAWAPPEAQQLFGVAMRPRRSCSSRASACRPAVGCARSCCKKSACRGRVGRVGGGQEHNGWRHGGNSSFHFNSVRFGSFHFILV